MTKICLYDEVPALIKPELLKYLSGLEHLVPDWCSHVWVGWRANDTGDDSTVAEVTVYYEYRWARMTVYACWLDQTPEFKHEAMVHELMHVFVAPLSDYARDIVKLLLPADEAPKFREATVTQLRERIEMVTEDFTRLVLNGQSTRGMEAANKEPYAEAQT